MGKRRKRKTKRPAKIPSRKGRSLYGPLHPWRICPIGQHWVRAHERKVAPSEKHPDGKTPVHGYCQGNRSHKDHLYGDEIHRISETYFSSLSGPPSTNDLGFRHGNDFDEMIRGWTKYWNEIFLPKDPLDPDLVKALIATESGFDVTAGKRRKGKGAARGLMQLTDDTRDILGDTKGELSDFLVTVSKDEVYDPSANIAGGVRWLFHKKKFASNRLKRAATWEDAVAEYKSYFNDLIAIQKLPKGRKLTKKQQSARDQMARFHDLFEQLKAGE